MGLVASIGRRAGGGWTLALHGHEFGYAELEEAVEEARAELRREGGGTIEIVADDGESPDRIEVHPEPTSAPAPEPAAPPAPPTARPAPPPSQPSPAPPVRAQPEERVRADEKAGEEPKTTSADEEIAALCAAYRKAFEEIEAFDDVVERDIGLGTLRLEAADTLARLQAGGARLDGDLRPLAACLASLSGGKSAQAAVKLVDKGAEKALKEVGKSLIQLKATASVAFVLGVLAAVFNASAAAGGSVLRGVLQGGIAVGVVFRAVMYGGPASERAAAASWERAASLGQQGERALSGPREIERRLLERCGDTGSAQFEPLALAARRRAKGILVVCWLAVAFAAIAFGWGAIQEFANLANPEPIVPTTTTPFP